MIVDIEFRGIALEIHGEQGKQGGFRIGRIFVETTDVYDMLLEHLEELEQLVIQKINEQE